MGTGTPQLDRNDLRRELALAAHKFPDWERPAENQQAMMSGEFTDLLVMLGAGLVVLDEHLDAVDGVLSRLRSLYQWVRSLSSAQDEAAPRAEPSLSERERLLVLLFDAYVRSRRPIEEGRLAALSGLALTDCQARLTELNKLGLIREAAGRKWMFKSG